MNNKLIFLDTETTTNTDDAEIVSVAYMDPDTGALLSQFFKPLKPIQVEAMAVTHITNKMVADCPAFEDSSMQKDLRELFDAGAILVAHNAEFDERMLKTGGITVQQRICTMKCARALDTKDELPQYKLQYIRYAWDIEIDANAHDAADDVLVLEAIFKKLLEQMSIEDMIKITNEPFLLRKMQFGKYKGQKFADIGRNDKSYLQWLRRQDGMSGDLLYTINYYLTK
jgi:exodeoxyribonuclease X